MSARSICPDYSTLDIPMDAWSEPFWQAGAEGRMVMPRCCACGTFRWPAGPFCPECHTQPVDWVAPGEARIFSFTILPVPGETREAPPQFRVPVLAEFAAAPGVRLVSVLVDAPLDAIQLGAPLDIAWRPASNGQVPVFRLAGAPSP
jgi:uncharacterized protein